MKHLIKEIEDLFNRPRLLVQYAVLNFFLISVGVAAVTYTRNELVVEQSKVQSEKIISTTQSLENVHLPAHIKDDIINLKQNAEQTLKVDGVTTDPKNCGSSPN